MNQDVVLKLVFQLQSQGLTTGGSLNRENDMKKILFILFAFVIAMVAGCTTVNRSYVSPRLASHAKWVVFPLTNNTQTPLAGLRAQAITAGVLRSRGIYNVSSYQTNRKFKDYLPGSQNAMSKRTMLNWAKRNHAQYAVTGTVNEWRYKIGIDGEPAAGIGLVV